MEYIEGTKYPISEYENIAKWWQDNREYDINKRLDDDPYIEIVRRSDTQIITDLRMRREYECFPYINRGSLWYDTLTAEQKAEFQTWYQAWLNATETLIAPTKPEWLK